MEIYYESTLDLGGGLGGGHDGIHLGITDRGELNMKKQVYKDRIASLKEQVKNAYEEGWMDSKRQFSWIDSYSAYHTEVAMRDDWEMSYAKGLLLHGANIDE